ncbi:hypothetical protein ACWEKM_20625 [Streptomyces sp. NPDC004752]
MNVYSRGAAETGRLEWWQASAEGDLRPLVRLVAPERWAYLDCTHGDGEQSAYADHTYGEGSRCPGR